MAGRSALTWPFQSGAWPNQPIGTGATYLNGKIVARTSGQAAVKPQEVPMGMDTTQPSVPMYQNAGQNDPNRCLGSQGLFSPEIDIPYNQNLLIPSAQTNYPPAFLGADGATRFEGGNFAHCTNGGKVTAGHFGNHGTITDNAVGGGSGGSGMSTLAGTIRYGEFTNGTDGVSSATVGGFTFKTIRHCLRIDLAVSDLGQGLDGKGYVWPANKADGGFNVVGNKNYYSGTVPSLVNGTLLAIPQSVNLNTLGLVTNPAKQLAWTLQFFGCRTANTQSNSTWAICTEWSVSSSNAVQRVAEDDASDVSSEFFGLFGFPMFEPASNQFAKDMNTLLTNLYVVSNDSSTNIGGGGTPLTALAPAFGATLNPPFLQQVNGNTSAAASSIVVANTKTAVGSGLGLLVGARAPVGTVTPAQVGSSWASAAQSGTSNTTAVLAAHTITGGNYVTVTCSNRVASAVGAISSVTDSLGNSYARLSGAQEADATSILELEIWGAHVTTGGSATITVTFASAGTGSGIASEWSGLSESLDITTVVSNGSGNPLGPLSSGPTVKAGDLVIASFAATGTPVYSGAAFSPAGTTVNVPDITVQNTGVANHLVGTNEIISGAAGNAQSFSASITGKWCLILVCLAPAAGGGSAPTVSISGGGSWTQAYSVNSPSGLGNSSAWYLSPTGQVAANGVTITSSISTGSIEYEFYEIANGVFQAQTSANATSAAPTVQITPTATTDVQIGSVFVPNISATVTPTSVASWENDAVTQGLATNANSQIVSGGNVAVSVSAQTYSATLSASSPWVAGILNFDQIGAPSQVSQPSIAAGNAQVSVNWTTPNNNGSPLTSYTAKVYSGVNADGSGGSLANTITGIVVIDYSITPYVIGSLSNGTRYSVSITAINGVGSSTESQRSVGATPQAATTVPGTPVAPAVVVGDAVATVTITPPATGGLPIEGYTFNCYQGVTLVSTQTQLSNIFTFSGLTDGTQYGFTGIAFNGNGNSLESPATLAIPVGAPATPNAPVCVAGNAQVTVTGQIPANNGSGISSYTFNCYQTPGGTVLQTVTQPGLTTTFVGLNNGTTYYFTTLATNAIGTSNESAASPATPKGSTPPTPSPGQGRSVQAGTTYQYIYKGKTTHMLYKFAPVAVPTALLDQYGNLLEYGTYNGETLVFCSQDGEPRRSVKGTPGASDPYGFGVAVAPWESNV